MVSQQLVRDMVKRMTKKAQMEELFTAVRQLEVCAPCAHLGDEQRKGIWSNNCARRGGQRELEGRSTRSTSTLTDLAGPNIGTL